MSSGIWLGTQNVSVGVSRPNCVKSQTGSRRYKQARSASSLKPKSAGRKEVGRLKAESLRLWRQDFSAAREALKREGYKGSLKLKKGMPMYTKIEEMREARAANQARSALASEMPAFRRREDCLVGPGGS